MVCGARNLLTAVHEIIVSRGLDCAEVEVEVGEVVLLHVLIQYFKLEKMAVEL